MAANHFEALLENTKQTFDLLKNQEFLDQFYLAGGTALALHLGHRSSADLDFFSKENFNEQIILQDLPKIGEFQLEEKSKQTIIGILNNTKLSFLGYNYPLLNPLEKISNVSIADIYDIACMKIDTISSRGAKRDFVDIYFIAKEIIPLREIMILFQKKYVSLNYNMMHIKKGLVYFDDAESDPMPNMLKPADWQEIKYFFQDEIKKLL